MGGTDSARQAYQTMNRAYLHHNYISEDIVINRWHIKCFIQSIIIIKYQPNTMTSPSQTKNLVSIYQKMFNLGLKKYKAQAQDESKIEINIRKCAGVRAFKQLLIQHPRLRQLMIEMFESGELLQGLIKWKGVHCNMAIALKYFHRLHLIIKNPEVENISWTYGTSPIETKSEMGKTDAQTQSPEPSTIQQIKLFQSDSLIEIYNYKDQCESIDTKETYEFSLKTEMQDIEIVKTGSHSIGMVIMSDPFMKMEMMYASNSSADFEYLSL